MSSLGLYTIVVFCLMNCSLHFIYGAGEDALKLTREFGSVQNVTGEKSQQLCLKEISGCEQTTDQWAPQVILFVAQLILGVGSAVFWIVGIAYMDDNSTKSKTPAMLSKCSTISIRNIYLSKKVLVFQLIRLF